MIEYEWDIETIDPEHLNEDDPDIMDHDWSHNCPGIPTEPNKRLTVVRDEIDQGGSVLHRTWAYVENGELPDYFVDALGRHDTRVPKRLHDQLRKTKRVKQ